MRRVRGRDENPTEKFSGERPGPGLVILQLSGGGEPGANQSPALPQAGAVEYAKDWFGIVPADKG